MAKRLPARLIAKLDEYLEWKDQRLRRDSLGSAVGGAIFLFLSIYHLVREGLSFTVIFTFVCACALFFWSIWYFLVYQRSLSVKKTFNEELSQGPKQAQEVARENTLNISSTPDSVTESTTKHLDTSRPRNKV
jgi:hypothetical protein